MGVVRSLTAHRNKHTVAALRRLLDLTEHTPVEGLAICAITQDGPLIVTTGTMGEDSSTRLVAAIRLAKFLHDNADGIGSH